MVIGRKVIYSPVLLLVLIGPPLLCQEVEQKAKEPDAFASAIAAKTIPDLARAAGAATSESFPESVALTSLIREQCRLTDEVPIPQQLAIIESLSPLLRRGCLYPIVLTEFMRRRDQLYSAKYVKLPRSWEPYTLQAAQFSPVLFAPSSPERVVSAYIALRQALRISTLGFTTLLSTQYPDRHVPFYSDQLLRVNAAGRASIVLLRMAETTTFLESKNNPIFLERWRALIREATTLALKPYEGKILELSQSINTTTESVRLRHLRKVFTLASEIREMGEGDEAVAEDLLRFSVGLRCNSETTCNRISAVHAALAALSSEHAKLNDRDIVSALECASVLPDLTQLVRQHRASSERAAAQPFSPPPGLVLLVSAAQKELDKLLGSLELYITNTGNAPFF